MCQTRPKSFSLAAQEAVSFLVFVFAYFFSPLEGGIVLEYRVDRKGWDVSWRCTATYCPN